MRLCRDDICSDEEGDYSVCSRHECVRRSAVVSSGVYRSDTRLPVTSFVAGGRGLPYNPRFGFDGGIEGVVEHSHSGCGERPSYSGCSEEEMQEPCHCAVQSCAHSRVQCSIGYPCKRRANYRRCSALGYALEAKQLCDISAGTTTEPVVP